MTKFEDLLALAKKLRSKTGCPWDKKQTIESMLKCLSDEAEEVAQAISKKDHKNLREELGDLLFNIVLITQIAKEEKLFTMDQVIRDIDKKIRRRHTWVFGKHKVKDADHALELWKKNKIRERKKK